MFKSNYNTFIHLKNKYWTVIFEIKCVANLVEDNSFICFPILMIYFFHYKLILDCVWIIYKKKYYFFKKNNSNRWIHRGFVIYSRLSVQTSNGPMEFNWNINLSFLYIIWYYSLMICVEVHPIVLLFLRLFEQHLLNLIYSLLYFFKEWNDI